MGSDQCHGPLKVVVALPDLRQAYVGYDFIVDKMIMLIICCEVAPRKSGFSGLICFSQPQRSQQREETDTENPCLQFVTALAIQICRRHS